MQPRSVRFPLFLSALAALLIAGCGKNNPMAANGASPGSAADRAAVSNTVAATTNLVDDGLMEAADQALFSATDPQGAFTAIRPLRYWRRITSVKRTYEFAFSDTDTTGRPTRAVVTVHKVLTGTFNVAFDATPGDTMAFDTLGVVHKPLHDLWARRILLNRVKWSHHDSGDEMGSDPDSSGDDHQGEDHHGDDHDQWKVSGISGVDVRSFTPPDTSSSMRTFGNTEIKSVRIQTSTLDTTITDPLQFVMLRRVHCFGPSENVMVTVTTASDTDVVVLVRPGIRHRFHNNGDGTYTLSWQTSFEDGIRHFGVNAISKGTLFDDQAPYDSDAWLFPYMIRPWSMATYMP